VTCLPNHGRVDCTLCYRGEEVTFDRTSRAEGTWRITANPLAWGNRLAKIVVLGFSKGPAQAGVLTVTQHDMIAYKGGRANVGKIFSHIGLIPPASPDALEQVVNKLIRDRNGLFHFGSLVRCTVERFDSSEQIWKGSGGGMLDKFVGTNFGREVVSQYSSRFLGSLPSSTKLIVMFGLGTKGNYVKAARRLIEVARAGAWRDVNEVAYTDGRLTVVHVEHFKSQGALIPNWLGETGHERSRLGVLARTAVAGALVN
jgi:hypothetical protein